ncbi:MAG: biopolymer transport protein ExbB [Oceanicoccus sp.]|jgi:biopolymer transport protein ExbB
MKYIISVFICAIASSLAFAITQDNSTPAVPENIKSLQQLLQQVKDDGLKETSIHKERERVFLQDATKQKQALKTSKAELKQVRQETEQLKNTFDKNEENLANLEDELRKRMGNLGEMFGVVRQVSQDVASIRENSLLANELGAHSALLDQLSESKALPSISELEKLWYEMQLHMTKQGESKQYITTYLNSSGQKVEAEIAHIGPFVAFNNKGFLNYDTQTQIFIELGKQPSEASLIGSFLTSTDEFSEMVIDPTRGTLLSIGSQSPSVFDRIQQGGLIGYIILFLAFCGFVYSVFLLSQRLRMQAKMKGQLENPDAIDSDNPLGRVLAVYQNESSAKDLETLEMKLDEAVLKELPELEKGLSIVKLLAAVAPLLGLLGTVTGMIATFQSITLFGTGDPKLMAGGISQALITTVLGLVAAIPLLFMHNILNGRSKEMIQVLDQQAAGIIAEQAQKRA